MTDLTPKHRFGESHQLTCRAGAPKTRHQFEPASFGKYGIQGEIRCAMCLFATP